MKILTLAFLVLLGALSTPTIATTNQDLDGFAEWSPPVNLGAPLNTAAEESGPALSDDGRSLYFNRNPNLYGDNDEDLYVSHRSRGGPWGDPVPLMTVNTPTAWSSFFIPTALGRRCPVRPAAPARPAAKTSGCRPARVSPIRGRVR